MKKISTVAKRSIGFALSAALILGTLSGCGKGKSEDSFVNQATKNSKEYVFRTDKIDFLDGTDYSNISMVGDKVYATTYAVDGGINLFTFTTDGSEVNTVKVPEADNESHGYITFDDAGNMYSILTVYDWGEGGEIEIQPNAGTASDEDSDGSFGAEDTDASDDTDADATTSDETTSDDADTENASESTDSADSSDSDTEVIELSEDDLSIDLGEGMGDYGGSSEEKQYLVKIDPSGKELFRVDLNSKVSEDEYFTVYSMAYLEGTGLLMSSNLGIEKYDDQGNLVSKVLDTTDSGSQYYQIAVTLYKGSNGTLFTSYWGDNGLEFRPFDLATGKFGEKSNQFSSYDDYTFFSGNGYDLYVSKSDGFYGYTQAKDTITKILDYADSDINMSYSLSIVVAVSDKEFIANLPDEEYNYALYKLTKVAPEDVKDKTVITLAGNYVDYNVRQKVFKFNQESDDYKIKIIDYASLVTSDDYNASANQFNLDIVSGNVPDIMVFTTEEPVDSYINKGLFLDLNTLLQNDPELKDVEFVDNVMEAFKTGDKLYQLVPSFYIESLATKTEYLGGKETLTIKECDDMIQSKGVSYLNSFGMYDKQSLLYSGLVMSGSHFIDWENKTCNFGGEEFINFLEFTNKFPDNITDEMWEQYEDTAYMKGDSLFSFAYVNGFRPYRRYVDATFAGDIKFIGFPNNMGVNCSVIVPEMRFSISAQSKNADAAWQLLRQFLLEDYQNEITYEFPIRKSSYDKLANESMERMFWIDDDGVKQYEDDIMYLGDQEVVVQPMTQEEVDYVKNFVGSLNMVYSANENVYNIITEEASAYFSGQKSAKEVADIIQSRVSIYVNENS
jgi:hypothetical protein